ncbi:MAG: acetyl-CoA carboxylase carboxyltransferase subunit alpha [Spirochaetes bacterium]|nr:acetyl-CoA carboxylase carboxyltransferase subunit alpha [Spirochaetota bacterium]
MATTQKLALLEFEASVGEIFGKIEDLKKIAGDTPDAEFTAKITRLEDEANAMLKDIYGKLDYWQITQVARHIQRPLTLDYVSHIFSDFTEMHGDRNFADDGSTICGIATLEGRSVVVIGHQKGRSMDENIKRNFGMPNPEAYRKALRFMKMAEKFNKPIVTFVDTPGAYPGMGGEERGQAEAIARNLFEMSKLAVPVIACIIGEGGSGGALGIAVANRVLMMQYAIYSVISPESCASILWRDSSKKERAANALKNGAPDALKLGIIDVIVPEPLGGAHRNHALAAANLKKEIVTHLADLSKLSPQQLKDDRLNKFAKMGVINETATA